VKYLGDTSALTRRQTRPEVEEVVVPLLINAEIATCGIVDLEILYAARNKREHGELLAALQGLARVELVEPCVRRALEVQGMLAERSQHRGVSISDLLIAACAEQAGLVLLHYDTDFELIAAVTGQPAEWVVARGSVS
jgi:predicted nucleic acid-binding protein